METRIIEVHTNDSHDPAIQEAVRLLQAGDVVAIPTETVYGLAANALDAGIVRKIFEAKGRPSSNPVIVHVASAEHAKELVSEWPAAAGKLAEAFWPGPLTLVLKKAEAVPDVVTAGGDTVAIRCPNHPIALSLISACAFPLAAPSANRSNAISPTTAVHVAKSLGGRIPLIVDGGPCEAGIESTVVAIEGETLLILRPGAVSADQIKAATGMKVKISGGSQALDSTRLQSPGRLPVHYAPETPLHLQTGEQFAKSVTENIGNSRIGLMGFTVPVDGEDARMVQMPGNAGSYAQRLYAVLHELDNLGLEGIFCELPPDEPQWSAVRDRLLRASSSK